MNKNKLEIINKIITYLQQFDEIEIAYIFGSFVNKENYHDIDIAVYLNRYFNKKDYEKYPYGYESDMINNLNRLIKYKIDFLVMNKTDIYLQKNIINKEMLLFCRNDSKRIAYKNYIRKLYIDFENTRKIKRKYLTGKITNTS